MTGGKLGALVLERCGFSCKHKTNTVMMGHHRRHPSQCVLFLLCQAVPAALSVARDQPVVWQSKIVVFAASCG